MVKQSLKRLFTVIQKEQTTPHDLSNEVSSFEEKLSLKIDWCTTLLQPSLDSTLHIVSRNDKLELLEWLIENGAKVCLEQQNRDGKTPLHEAAQNSSLTCVQYLLAQGAKVNPLNRGDWTPLMLACTKRSQTCIDIVKLLIQNGAKTSLVNKDGWNALHIACRSASEDVVQYLFQIDGQACHNVSNNKRMILHTAALHNRVDLLSLLKSHCDFDINTADSCGSTAFMEACRAGNTDFARQLTQFWPDCDTNQVDVLGRSVLQVTCEAGQIDVVKMLIDEYHLDPMKTDTSGQTSVHSAAREGHSDLVKLLVTDYGCDVGMKDNRGRDAAWVASANKHSVCHDLLISLNKN